MLNSRLGPRRHGHSLICMCKLARSGLVSHVLVPLRACDSPLNLNNLLQNCSDMPQLGNLQKASHATTPGVSWSVAVLQISGLGHVRTVLQYKANAVCAPCIGTNAAFPCLLLSLSSAGATRPMLFVHFALQRMLPFLCRLLSLLSLPSGIWPACLGDGSIQW